MKVQLNIRAKNELLNSVKQNHNQNLSLAISKILRQYMTGEIKLEAAKTSPSTKTTCLVDTELYEGLCKMAEGMGMNITTLTRVILEDFVNRSDK
jgi:hypothetical protein